jgi:hypothetical protein
MTFYTLIPLVFLLICMFSLAFVIALNQKHPAYKAFIYYNICVSLFLIKDFCIWSSISSYAPTLILKIGSVTWLSLGLLFLYFVYELLRKKKDLVFLVLSLSVVSIILISLFTDLIIPGYVRYYWGIQARKGSLTFFAIAYTLAVPFSVQYVLTC